LPIRGLHAAADDFLDNRPIHDVGRVVHLAIQEFVVIMRRRRAVVRFSKYAYLEGE
jgi:hypothetical protein